jgi:DNA-binding transcriptional LysR family regulator
MHLQTDYLRTFIALADTKGFTRAGRQVNRSQSAVSMQIKRLEDEIGKKLFERIGKTVKLTAEGNILIKYAMRIVKEHDDAIRALSKPDLEGFVRFGSPEHYTIGILPRLLARFASAYPDVVVEMRCENSDEIKADVDKGELDIGICTQISDGGQVISHDPVVWVADPGFVMQNHQTVSIAVFEEGCIFRTWALEALEKIRDQLPDRLCEPQHIGAHRCGQSRVCGGSDHSQQRAAGLENCRIGKWPACFAGLKYCPS